MTNARLLCTTILLVAVAACTERTLTDPPSFARGSTSATPVVTGTSPTGSGVDTTLDVRVFGSDFDRTASARMTLAGVPSSKVRTNSTRYVSGAEVIANITVTADADLGAYDVEVMLSTGKKGIGTEMFAVQKVPPGQATADPALTYEKSGNIWVVNLDGNRWTDLGLTGNNPSWGPGGDGSVLHPYRVAYRTPAPNSLSIVDVDTVGGAPRARTPRQLTGAKFPAGYGWSPAADEIATAGLPEPGWATSPYLVVVSVVTGAVTRLYTSPDPSWFVTGITAWSPDGQAIAFSEQQPYTGTTVPMTLKVINRASGAATTIIPYGTAIDGMGIYDLDWSRDGRTIAFRSARPMKGTNIESWIFLIDVMKDGDGNYVAAGPWRPLARGVSPTWSPGGRQMFFSRNGSIMRVNPETGATSPLTSGERPDWRR